MKITNGMTNVRIAELLNVDEATIRRAVKRYNKEYGYLVDESYKREVFIEGLDSPLRIYLDDVKGVAITADWHVPLTNLRLVNAFLSTCKRLGIRILIIAGDYWNADSLSKYYPKQENAGKEVELEFGNWLMDQLLDVFDEVYFLKGNHDYRFVAARDYSISFVDAMRGAFSGLDPDRLARINFSNLDHMYVEDDPWIDLFPNNHNRYYICHPTAYSQVPGTVALKLAAKYPNCNIITGHSHHCALMYDKSGRQLCVEIGGFFDRKITQYLQSTSTFPVWTPGFGILTKQEGFVLYPGDSRCGTQNILSGLPQGLSSPS